MLDFGFYEMERKEAIIIAQIVPLSSAILDAGTALFFICRTCQKTYGFYNNRCCEEAVQPVIQVRILDKPPHSKWRTVKKLEEQKRGAGDG